MSSRNAAGGKRTKVSAAWVFSRVQALRTSASVTSTPRVTTSSSFWSTSSSRCMTSKSDRE